MWEFILAILLILLSAFSFIRHYLYVKRNKIHSARRFSR